MTTTEAQKRATKKWILNNPDIYKSNYDRNNKKRDDKIKSNPELQKIRSIYYKEWRAKKKSEALNASS